MKKLTCEMCGSTDLVKQDGVFVCQSCGCKYSVEEAKKMMIEGPVDVSGSTVKVDTQQKKENLYEIARRARDDNNSTAAAKYYDMILQEDPFSWEASFYATYYAAMDTKVGQMADSAATVSNCFNSVLNLIKERVPESEQGNCVKEIIARVKIIADMYIYNAENNSDNDHSRNWIRAALSMQYNLGDCIAESWPKSDNFKIIAVIAWKEAVENELRDLKEYYDLDSMDTKDWNDLRSVVNFYMKKIGAIDRDYYQKYLGEKVNKEIETIKKEISAKECDMDAARAEATKSKSIIVPACIFGVFIVVMGIFLLGLGAADSLGTWILLLGGAFLFWVGYSSIGDVAKSKDKIATLTFEIEDLRDKLVEYEQKAEKEA